MEMTLLDSELKYFIQLAKSKTLLSASENVGLSQPALSRAMNRLEDKLGFKVLRRSRSGFELTEQGQELLENIKGIHEDIDSMIRNIRDRSSEISGEIRIAGHGSILQDFLLPHYASLTSEFPKVRFHIESKPSREVVTGIVNRQVDIGLVINPLEFSSLMIRNLAPTKAQFYSSAVAPDRYFLNPQMIDMNRFLKVLRKKYHNENNVTFIDDYDLIASLVRQKMGCGLLPDHVAQRYDLSVNQELSSLFKTSFDLKLVVSSAHLTEKKRKILRRIETLIKG